MAGDDVAEEDDLIEPILSHPFTIVAVARFNGP
jgi:hypothetical protein